jgi:anthranilate phosphoribosyltransferase
MTERALEAAIRVAMHRNDVAPELLESAFVEILEGRAHDVQIAALGVALRTKGESVTELATLVQTIMRFANTVPDPAFDDPVPLIDTCGTGGDHSGTFNVSTTAALVAVGAGARIAKHGNRAVSSQCGSADVLDALGVAIELGPDGVAMCLRDARIGFCFAPRFHPAWRHAGPARRALAVPTTFNVLGPLANPARVRRQVVGIPDPELGARMVATLQMLGHDYAMVVTSHDGLDELSTTTPNTAYVLAHGTVSERVIDPLDLGLARATPAEIRGGDVAENAAIVRSVLAGERSAYREMTLLNAAAALVVSNLAADIGEGLVQAAAAIDSGNAAATLERFVAVSQAALVLERADNAS